MQGNGNNNGTTNSMNTCEKWQEDRLCWYFQFAANAAQMRIQQAHRQNGIQLHTQGFFNKL